MYLRTTALILTALTGFSGLVYEVTWQKYLATLLGSHSEATAAVLAIFLGGLSVGYRLFGRLTRSLVRANSDSGSGSRVLLVYGAVEASIGVYAFAFPWIFGLAQDLSLWVSGSNAALAFAADVLLSAILIGPASVLMGATIPMLTQALCRGLEDATRFHALVYGCNTLGAFAGALAAGFWLIPELGLVRVLFAMGALNIVAGALLAGLARQLGRKGDGGMPSEPARPPPARVEGLAYLGAAALLSGFAMMSVQTVLIRVGGLALGSSHFTFSMVVAVFVGCIALGSFGMSLARRIPPGAIVANQCALAALLALLYLQVHNAPYWAHLIRIRFGTSPDELFPYYATCFAAAFAVLALPIALSGAILPLLFHHLRNKLGELGAVAGQLYGWNTVGALLGALLGGYVLLFWLDLHHVYRLAVAMLVLSAGLLGATLLRVHRGATAVLVVACMAGLFALPPWSQDHLSTGLFRLRAPLPGGYTGPDDLFAQRKDALGLRVIFSDDDPTMTVAVVEHATLGGERSLAILTNGKPDGSLLADSTTTTLLAIVPALFAERPERAFVIGYGAGATVGELAALDSMREVVVAEISRGVIEAAPLFDYGNLAASQSPKVKIQRIDAYRALRRSAVDYDLIVSEPSNPWVTGVEMLFSREFLEAAKSRLRKGGVYGQWIHIYETDDATVGLVLRTFASVFEHWSVWYTESHDLLILGFREEAEDSGLDRLIERAGQADYRAALARARVSGVPALLAHELLPLNAGPLSAGPLHSLLHPILSDWASRAFFPGLFGRLPTVIAPPGSTSASLLRTLARRQESGALSEEQRAEVVQEICKVRVRECATALAHWQEAVPESVVRQALMGEGRIGVLPQLAPRLLSDLATLYRVALRAPRRGESALKEARLASRRFADYYFHAFPFERRSLDAHWSQCKAQPQLAARCETARTQLERELGLSQ